VTGSDQQRLLDAAADEFSERSMASARLDRRIAQLAGCTKALIYSYSGERARIHRMRNAHLAMERNEQASVVVPGG
jgi:AcrR family transcriptional regulator